MLTSTKFNYWSRFGFLTLKFWNGNEIIAPSIFSVSYVCCLLFFPTGGQYCILICVNAERGTSKAKTKTRRHRQHGSEIDTACTVWPVQQKSNCCLNSICVTKFCFVAHFSLNTFLISCLPTAHCNCKLILFRSIALDNIECFPNNVVVSLSLVIRLYRPLYHFSCTHLAQKNLMSADIWCPAAIQSGLYSLFFHATRNDDSSMAKLYYYISVDFVLPFIVRWRGTDGLSPMVIDNVPSKLLVVGYNLLH